MFPRMRIHLTYTKRNGEFDALMVERDAGTLHIDCPKQRVLPHDMLHYVAMSVLAERGLLNGFGGSAKMIVASLVETLQAALWSGAGEIADLLRLFRATCRARGSAPPEFSLQSMERACKMALAFDRHWRGLETGETMTMSLPV